MALPERILGPVKKIRGGAKLPHRKLTAELPTVKMTNVDKVVIPMSQHIGAPCVPIVEVGSKVYVGTKVGDTDAFVSAPVFSSVSGEVEEIRDVVLANGRSTPAVIIKSDGEFTPDPSLAPHPVSNKADLVAAARNCGLVGLGGAGFPTSAKLSVKDDANIDTLIINAAECEPYIVSDYRECLENYYPVLEGIYMIKDVLGVKDVFLCVEDNKPQAINLLYRAATDKRDSDDKVHIMKLKSTYPQGAEKVMIYSATGRKLPIGKLPADVGCIVMNITSVAMLYNYITTGMPLTHKRLTVSGEGIVEPKNVDVPIGVSIGEVIDSCGGIKDEANKIVVGGPMMGNAVYDLDAPVTKQFNAITVYCEKEQKSTACINCGRCHSACPMDLFPAKSERAVRLSDRDLVNALNPEYCIGCGSCAFVCPAKRPLAQSMNLAKLKQKELNAK